jgi:hypothetical protein
MMCLRIAARTIFLIAHGPGANAERVGRGQKPASRFRIRAARRVGVDERTLEIFMEYALEGCRGSNGRAAQAGGGDALPGRCQSAEPGNTASILVFSVAALNGLTM